MVGPRVHRVDQRRERPSALPRPPAAHPAVRARLLRPAGARDPSRAGRARPRPRRRGLRLLALLVRRRRPHPRPSVPRGARLRGARTTRSAWRGPTRRGPASGTAPRDRVLKQQRYPGPDDDRRHFDELLPAFTDARYLTVDGRPVFYVFRPEELPERCRLRRAVAADGDGGRACRALPRRGDERPARSRTRVLHLDGRRVRRRRLHAAAGRGDAAQRGCGCGCCARPCAEGPRSTPTPTPSSRRPLRGPHIQPCVYPNWDNTPRSGRGGLALVGATPEKFRRNVGRRRRHARATGPPRSGCSG